MTMRQNSLQKQVTALKRLQELSSRLQGILESESFTTEILHAIQGQFDVESLRLWHVESNGSLILEAQAGETSDDFRPGQRCPARQGLMGQVVESRKILISGALVFIPILYQSQLLAVLNITFSTNQNPEEEDLLLFEGLASQVSLALSNYRLISEMHSFNRKLQTAMEDKTLELRRAHERILEQQKLLQNENKALRSLVDQDRKTHDFIGQSAAIRSLLQMVDKIAPTSATVLVLGESGTGKELVARRLHQKSTRSEKPFVTINCGALQESLLESELFGHEKGSFTGAFQQKIGLCEVADGGTLFLDEIGELSPAIQAKLLRFIQEGEFYRIGGKHPLQVDVRVVSATNRDLEQEVKTGVFREDLYYRLNTIAIKVPPLRKHKEDLPELVDYFLKTPRFGGMTHQIRRVDPRVVELFSHYDWPGNVRELQNTVERMKILAENHEIRVEDVPSNIRMPRVNLKLPELSTEVTLEGIEKSHILRVLALHQGNKTKTAKNLGITIKTLYNKLHRYGILMSETDQTVEKEKTYAL